MFGTTLDAKICVDTVENEPSKVWSACLPTHLQTIKDVWTYFLGNNALGLKLPGSEKIPKKDRKFGDKLKN